MQYPKWLYHKEKAPVLVTTKDEEKELGKEWADTPAKFNNKIVLLTDKRGQDTIEQVKAKD